MSSKKEGSSKSAGTKDVEDVGYGKPPKRTQFKPGRSGNPGGRPEGVLNGKTILKRNLLRKVNVREGNIESRVSKYEGIFMRLIEQALKGDHRAAQQILKLSAELGAVALPVVNSDEEVHSLVEQQILDEVLKKLSDKDS